MKKIPTLFLRNIHDMKHVTPSVHADCTWVLAGQGVATRKYDGTCVMVDSDGTVWSRREVKPGKQTPEGFVLVQVDETTGKAVGWEPSENSSFAKYIEEAYKGERFPPGTYELIGPKINGNPENYSKHVLIEHGCWELDDVPRNFWDLEKYLLDDSFKYEGIVWHHPDGRMAKLKKRDFQ